MSGEDENEAVTYEQFDARKHRILIRWMIRRDMNDVVAIERKSFQFAWTEENFISALRQRNCIGMVAEEKGEVRGYMLYELHKRRLHILNFAVSEWHRRSGIGTQMIRKLYGKLSLQRRDHMLLEVRETNLDAQLFFQNMRFRCINTLRSYYNTDTDEDAYLMRADYYAPWGTYDHNAWRRIEAQP